MRGGRGRGGRGGGSEGGRGRRGEGGSKEQDEVEEKEEQRRAAYELTPRDVGGCEKRVSSKNFPHQRVCFLQVICLSLHYTVSARLGPPCVILGQSFPPHKLH